MYTLKDTSKNPVTSKCKMFLLIIGPSHQPSSLWPCQGSGWWGQCPCVRRHLPDTNLPQWKGKRGNTKWIEKTDRSVCQEQGWLSFVWGKLRKNMIHIALKYFIQWEFMETSLSRMYTLFKDLFCHWSSILMANKKLE